MTKHIETVKQARTLLLEGIKDLNAEQLNKIPAGFNNNINWNMGHLIAVQQAVCYKRASLPVLISDDFWERFKPGSKPDIDINDDEITHIKQLLLITLDRLETDYNKNIFGNYTAWTTRQGVELASIDDGIKFLLFHERLHSAAIMAIKRLV
jgi:hypothetical protein